MQPPRLPAEILARVLRLAKLDGTGLLVISGAFALGSAMLGDKFGAGIGLLIAGAGAVELHGVGLLRYGEYRGIRWLMASQALLLGLILGYCWLKLANMDLAALHVAFQRGMEYPFFRDAWAMQQELGVTETDFLIYHYRLTYRLVAFVTCLYQGGMILYYLRRRDSVRQALATE